VILTCESCVHELTRLEFKLSDFIKNPGDFFFRCDGSGCHTTHIPCTGCAKDSTFLLATFYSLRQPERMSIATKTGDDGTTGLLFNRRVLKHDPRVEAYGTVDELNTALGLARSLTTNPRLNEAIRSIQLQLVNAMGELAVLPEDVDRYVSKGHSLVTESDIDPLNALVLDLEKNKGLKFDGWATPGANPVSAAYDHARTACRRAERNISALNAISTVSDHVRAYFNRLSDVLWLTARLTENDFEF